VAALRKGASPATSWLVFTTAIGTKNDANMFQSQNRDKSFKSFFSWGLTKQVNPMVYGGYTLYNS